MSITNQVSVSAEVQAFLDWMVRSEAMALEDVLYFLEKPWKWEKEFGNWLAEKQSAHLAFLCSPEDVDESGGYDRSDPKHPEYHSVHADIWDARDKVETINDKMGL